MIVFYGFGGVQADGGVVKQSKQKIVSVRCKYQNNNFTLWVEFGPIGNASKLPSRG